MHPRMHALMARAISSAPPQLKQAYKDHNTCCLNETTHTTYAPNTFDDPVCRAPPLEGQLVCLQARLPMHYNSVSYIMLCYVILLDVVL